MVIVSPGEAEEVLSAYLLNSLSAIELVVVISTQHTLYTLASGVEREAIVRRGARIVVLAAIDHDRVLIDDCRSGEPTLRQLDRLVDHFPLLAFAEAQRLH